MMAIIKVIALIYFLIKEDFIIYSLGYEIYKHIYIHIHAHKL